MNIDRDDVLREQEIQHDVGEIFPDTVQLHQIATAFENLHVEVLENLPGHDLQRFKVSFRAKLPFFGSFVPHLGGKHFNRHPDIFWVRQRKF